MQPELLLTNTLREHRYGMAVARVLAAALEAVDPAAAVHRFLQRADSILWVDGQAYDLGMVEQVIVVAIGKAGVPMLQATLEVLGDCVTQALAVVKEGHANSADHDFTILEAGHPIPDMRGVDAAQCVLDLLNGLGTHDLALVLLSGGGSALLTLPVAGVSLADMRVLTQVLLRCGATIQEINTLRKHLERSKGGSLVQAAGAAQVIALVLSDVVGDPLDVIASGPTYPDPTTYADAWTVLQRYAIVDQIPASIIAHLQAGVAGQVPETLKPSDLQAQRVQNVIVGNNRLAGLAACRQAEAEGFATIFLTASVQGEARVVAEVIAAIMREAATNGLPVARPGCIIAGGETTVTLRGNGRGGRNQELALAAVAPLAGLQDVLLVALATDGGDGPTDAAGAVVSGETLGQAQALGLDVAGYLANNDAYAFFDTLGDLLRPGPTRTNVNDLIIGFVCG